MKNKFFKILLSLIVCIVLLIPFSSEASVSAESTVKLNVSKKVIYLGHSYTLKLKHASGKIKWYSTDEKIATVDENGLVTPVSAGITKVVARNSGNKYICEVTIKTPHLNIKKKKLKVDESYQLTMRGAEVKSFTSSNEKVATVDANGLVTAISRGNATIYAACDDKKTYACNINVINNYNWIENPTFEDLAPTVNMSFEELLGNNGVPGYPEGFPEPGTYRLTVDLRWHVIMAYRKDSDGKYTIPVRYMLCASGSNSTPTPTGTFKMPSYRVRNSIFRNTNSYAQYWSLITGRIYFHTTLYSSLNASDYSVTSWNAMGTNVSHGCIRMTVPDARWIYYNCAPGTVVEIRSGSSNDKETAAIREKLKLAKAPDKRVKLENGKIPWTDNWDIESVPHEVGFVNGNQ